jgi:hypothetical protein
LSDKKTLPRLRLNKTRDHGIVNPPENGAHYYQDGFYFSNEGDLVTHPALLTPETEAKLERHVKLEAARRAGEVARRKSLEAEGINPDDIDAALSGDEAEDEESEDFNFVGWLRGEFKAPFFTIRKAVSEKYKVNLNKQKEVVDFLVIEQRLVDPSEVKVV